MSVNNILQQVQTYQKPGLVFLNNMDPLINWANKKYQQIGNITGNLGTSVGIELAPKMTSKRDLVVDLQNVQQRIQTLVCANPISSAFAFTSEQFVLNQMSYMNEFGKAAVLEIGTDIASHISQSIDSTMRYTGTSNLFGQVVPNNGPYRFYGDGVTPVNSFGQLASALNQFRQIGYSKTNLRCVLPINIVDQIVNSGLNQFALTRNNEMANSWQIGAFNNCEIASSNLLPIHIGGTVSQNPTSANRILTVVSTNDPTGQNITQITVTEPTGSTSANAIEVGDMFLIDVPSTRALTWIGRKPTTLKVQFVATDTSPSVAGTIVLKVRTATDIGLVSAPTRDQNMSAALIAGTPIVVIPSHQCGLIMSGDPLYLAMPKMPNMMPYPTANASDPNTNVSMRMYYGATFGTDQLGMVYDQIYGATLVPENCMRVIFPLTQGT